MGSLREVILRANIFRGCHVSRLTLEVGNKDSAPPLLISFIILSPAKLKYKTKYFNVWLHKYLYNYMDDFWFCCVGVGCAAVLAYFPLLMST